MTRAFWLPWATHMPAITFGEAALLRFSKAKDMLSSVRGAVGMTSPLLGNLITGAGSSSQLVGGLVIVLLYAVIGTLSAIGSILVFRRMFQGRWEQVFWGVLSCRDCCILPELRSLFRGCRPSLAN